MERKILAILLLLVSFSMHIIAQDLFSMLTDNNKKWYLYSEEVDEFVDGLSFISEQTFVSRDVMDALVFKIDGVLEFVSYLNEREEVKYNWILKDGEINITDNESIDEPLSFQITEISNSVLKLQTTVHGSNGYSVVYNLTYIASANERLSADEANLKNGSDAFKVERLMQPSHRILKSRESVYKRLLDDKKSLMVNEPSANSEAIAQLVLQNKFISDIFSVESALLFSGALPTLNTSGIREMVIDTKDKQSKISFNKEGRIVSVKKLNKVDADQSQINIEYDKVAKVPKSMTYSWTKDSVKFYMKDNWIFMANKNFDLYTGSLYFYEYIKDKDNLKLIKSRFYNNDAATWIELGTYNPETRIIDYHTSFDGDYEHTQYRLVYTMNNDSENKITQLLDISSDCQISETINIEQNSSIVKILVSDCNYGNRALASMITIKLNEKGNPEEIEVCESNDEGLTVDFKSQGCNIISCKYAYY